MAELDEDSRRFIAHVAIGYPPNCGEGCPCLGPVECITCEGECLVGDPTIIDGRTTDAHFRFDVVYCSVEVP